MEPKAARLRSQDRIREMVEAYWAEVRSAPAEGRPVCWSTMQSPAELLRTLGYSVVFPENYAATCGAWKVAGKFCAIAEDIGYSRDTCVYARNSLGAVASGRPDMCPVGGLPKPDLLVCLGYCSAVVKWYQELSRIYNAPLITIDYPYLHDHLAEDEIAEVSQFAADQLRDAVPLMEQVARRSLDYRRLQERMSITGEMIEAWNRILRLAQHVPSPVSCFDLFFNIFPMACSRGTTEGLTFLVGLEGELKERIDNRTFALPNEKYRLYWGGIPIWYRIGQLRRKFAEHGANIVASSYLYGWAYQGYDPAMPFEGSIPPQIRVVGNVGVSGQSEIIAQMVRDFSVDGAVWQESRSCKPMSIGMYSWVERLKKEFGLPVAIIEADMCDDRSFNEGRVDSEIQSFIEVLTSRPSPRR